MLFIKTLIGSLLLIFVGIALFPTFLSTEWGRQGISVLLKYQTNHSIECNELHLSWFGKQEMKGIILNDEKGNTAISIKKLSTKTSLIPFLLQGADIESLRITGLEANLSDPLILSLLDLLIANIDQIIQSSIILSREVTALFGQSPFLHIYTNWNLQQNKGDVDATLKGESGNLSLVGEIRDNTLLLKKELIAEFAITPEFKQSLLAKEIPFIHEISATEHPVKITISPHGFFLPLHSINLRGIQFKNASLDIGLLQFDSEGELGTAFNFLQKNLNKTFSIWCTPFYMRLKNGLLTFERMDFLVMDRYPLAIWGKSDLIEEKTEMVLGFTSQTLNKAFHIKNFPHDEIVQLPIKGEKGKFSFNEGKFSSQIKRLFIKNRGGVPGRILGAILDIADNGASKQLGENPSPAKMTNPLPWENKNQEKI